MRGLGVGLGLVLRRPTWLVQNDILDFGPGTPTGVSFVSLNAPNRFGVANSAGTLTEDVSTGLHVLQTGGPAQVAGSTYRLTGYIKPNARDCYFGFSSIGFGLNVALAAPSISSLNGPVFDYSVSVSTNGFRKLQFSFVSNTTGNPTIDAYCQNPVNTLSYTGDGASGLIIDETIFERLVA